MRAYNLPTLQVFGKGNEEVNEENQQCSDFNFPWVKTRQYFRSNRIIYLAKDLFIFRSLVNFVGLEKTVTEMATECLRMMKSCHICIK